MTYTVENINFNNLRFVFSFTAEEYTEAAKEYAAKDKKGFLDAARAGGDLRRAVITEMVRKAYSKAAMEYPREIYYSPALTLEQDDEKLGVVCDAKVQIDPEFTLGDYRALALDADEVAQVEREALTVPEPNRAETRRYLLQAAMVMRLDKICEGVVPDTMASERASQMIGAFEQQLDGNGKKIEDYYKECSTNEEELFADFMREAKKQLHSRLALYELAKKENLLATEEEYTAELARLADMSMMPPERLREIFARREEAKVRQDIAIAKAAEYLGKRVDELYPAK